METLPQEQMQNEKKVLLFERQLCSPTVLLEQIDFHPLEPQGDVAIASLRANCVDPRLHYLTPLQSRLWREVFLRHSPIHTNPEFGRIYRDAFARISGQIGAKEVSLIGLGCGTGLKELQLFQSLQAGDVAVHFSAIDASRELVQESVGKLVDAGARHERSLVCDLSAIDRLTTWLDQNTGNFPRIFTFFGLAPNLPPGLVIQLFRAVLRPGDVLLVSAHLAPVGEGIDLPTAMRSILPQYDNPETIAWLSAILDIWNIRDLLEPPQIGAGEIDSIPAIIAEAVWKSGQPQPLRLFHSLRYTPPIFESLLREARLNAECLAATACREEAIWSVRG